MVNGRPSAIGGHSMKVVKRERNSAFSSYSATGSPNAARVMRRATAKYLDTLGVS